MEQSRLYYLFDRYTAGTITSREELELAAYVVDPAYDADFAELEARYWEQLKDAADPLPDSAGQSLRTIFPARVIPLHKKIKVAIAAACIVLLLGFGSYLFFHNSSRSKELAQTPISGDVEAPEVTRATITLKDGRKVLVDSLTRLTQNNVALTKTADGHLIYSGKASEMIYNTLSNPKGSKVVDMTFADGSHVWLNAGSSVTYPVSFAGNERKVSMTGEAYFEVKHDAAKKFIVDANGTATEVLGTHFNVNAYNDEDAIRVTLLEGSVRITQNAETKMLRPGEQVVAIENGKLKIENNVDIEQVMAWKNGQFKFNRTDLKIIMREIGRWYNVEVSYEGNIPVQLYNVDVPRTVNVSEVLKGLEYTGAHFTIEGRKITVRP